MIHKRDHIWGKYRRGREQKNIRARVIKEERVLEAPDITERDRQRQRQTDRDRDTGRERDRDRDRDREIQTDRQTERQREREREKERERERERENDNEDYCFSHKRQSSKENRRITQNAN